ncbi:MAG: hypothetical protein ACI9MC_001130, partial [Kiritimatiellia bacterium]
GWNAGGLLVPALLALLILEPIKLSTTFLEIVLLTAIYRGITELPYIRNMELSGSRRLVAMYMMAWALKLSLAWVGLQLELPVAAWDLYGFGYLLSSLVAVRCLDLRPIGRVLLPMSVNLGIGASVGMLAATGLHLLLPPGPDANTTDDSPPLLISVPRSVLLAAGEVHQDPDAVIQSRRIARALSRLMQGEDRLPSRIESSTAYRQDGTACTAIRPEDTDGPHAWWCGGDKPLLYVPNPLSDPDSVWIAARMLDEGTGAGLVLSGLDQSLAPELARQHLRVMANMFRRTPMLVVRSTTDGPSTLRARGAAGRPPILPGRQEPVMVRVGGAATGPLWSTLQQQDGVLAVSVDELEGSFPTPIEPADGSLSPLADRHTEPLDPRTSWLMHLALHRAQHNRSFPAGLAWAAQSMDLQLRPTERGNWWLGSESGLGWGHWVIRPHAGSDWVVAAPRASIEPGTAHAALEMAERLDAKAVWIAHRGARGRERVPDRYIDGPDVTSATLRRALHPVAHMQAGRVLVVRRTSSAVPDPPVSMLAGAVEVLQTPPRDLMQTIEQVWPGLINVDGSFLPPASLGGQQPMRYVHSLQPDRSWVLWLRRDALAEIDGTEDREDLLRWYGLRGVEVVDRAHLPPLDERADALPLLEDLARHQQAPTHESLLSISQFGQAALIWEGLRLRLVVVGDDLVCISTNGAPMPSNSSGCWRRP